MKKLNAVEFCWWLIIGSLIVVIGKLLIFNELRFYLHPKMHPFVIGLEIVLIILFVFQQSRIFKAPTKSLKLGYFVFLIPLFMIIIAGDASAVNFENRTISMNELSDVKSKVLLEKKQKTTQDNSNLNFSETDSETAEKAKVDQTMDQLEEESVYDRLPEDEIDNPDPNATDPTNPDAGVINPVDPATALGVGSTQEDPFLSTLFNLEQDKAGQEVVLEGYVFKNEFFKENEFHISRMGITCCIADAMMMGMVVESPMAADLQNNEWVRVKGVTKMKMFKLPYADEAKMTMIIEAKEIEKIEPLESPYVYF